MWLKLLIEVDYLQKIHRQNELTCESYFKMIEAKNYIFETVYIFNSIL
jgi:hypothetical protein